MRQMQKKIKKDFGANNMTKEQMKCPVFYN